MIGFIDSGVGGLNVLCECAKLFNEDFVFLCDNQNCPYGNKSFRKLLKISRQNIDFVLLLATLLVLLLENSCKKNIIFQLF